MSAEREIAQEVGRYLQAPPLAQADAAPAAAPSPREVATAASGAAGWIWRQVEPRVKQRVCSQEFYTKLSGVPPDQLALRIEDILTPLVASVTASLPALLKFLVPLLPGLRRRVAKIIAQQLQQAAAAGWAAYCGRSASQ
jgi:hypothetical protein